jgi:hypothetical protein
MYNLGVFYARGMDGTHRNFGRAKNIPPKRRNMEIVMQNEAIKALLRKPIVPSETSEFDELFGFSK